MYMIPNIVWKGDRGAPHLARCSSLQTTGILYTVEVITEQLAQSSA